MNTRISEEARNNIAAVVNETFKAASEGVDPTKVLAKEATSRQLNKEETKRAIEASNVQMTLEYNKNASAADRAKSDFEIVKHDEVFDLMFPKEAKKKCKKTKKPEADAYELTETKEANLSLLDSEVELVELSEEQMYTKIASAIQKGEACLEEAQIQETAALHSVEKALDKVARMVEGLYGDSSASIEDEEVREYVNGMISKSASERPAREPSSLLVTATEELQRLLKEAAEKSDITAEVQQEVEGLKKIAADESTFNPLSGNPADGPIATPRLGKFDVARMVNPAVGTFLKMTTQTPGAQKQIRDNFAYNPTKDKNFLDLVATRETLKNAVMLSSLMRNDEVLKKADPKKVISSYNDIFTGMPQLTNNPELTRSALRYAVEYGGMDFPTMMGMVKDVDKMQGSMKSTNQRISEQSDKISEKGKAQEQEFTESVKEISKQKAEAKKEVEKERQRLKEKIEDLRRKDYDKLESREYSEVQSEKSREQAVADREETRDYSRTEEERRAEEAGKSREQSESEAQKKKDEEASKRRDEVRDGIKNYTPSLKSVLERQNPNASPDEIDNMVQEQNDKILVSVLNDLKKEYAKDIG